MFELNPLANPDALWQHILMLVVAAILGYIIGYITGNSVITELEDELSRLDNDLDFCNRQKPATKIVSNASRESFSGIAVESEKVQYDDLKIIEGIGPKIESILNTAGIHSFYQLSQKTPDQISAILSNSDSRFQVHDPATWPRQAEMASKGSWDELKVWQDILNGGREE
ncbi:hypothetical protein [Dyadobacter frigoris]|uniref:DUF4332 domain-containing protein n=1 Tax=Dyadobacter frigoris TaxID=2576211 RepID=A0A4U6D7F4_9BACT|nr:hypothetical protein [Dyadobacter frigoris]TKT92696.1 hypothetical protein FDK13_07760 [Dyadobacter frigoris]GLU51588.1 hypothetical protein Dfri01_10490 [Dyadobacter frigoris]